MEPMLKLLNSVLELEFNYMKKQRILFIALILSFYTYSQSSNPKYSNVQAELFYGFLIEHDTSLDNAIQGNTYGFLASWNTVENKNTKFNKLYNYPERGYSLSYQNFNSTILGEAYAAYRHYTYNLTPSKKNHLKLTTAFGLAYATKSYDAIENNQNFAFGSKLLVSAYFKLQYIHFFKNRNLSLNSSLNIIHYSNSALKNPNLGLNTVAFNIGFNYKLNPVEISKKDTIFDIDRSLKYHIILRGGVNESKEIGSGLYPFFTASFGISKTLNNYSTISGGVDYFNSPFIEDYSSYINNTENHNYPEDNPHRVGVFVGHELTQNHFGFISQIGVYAYQPVFYVSSIYERFGFRYKLSEHLISEVSLKANLFRAETLEFGLGYTF